MHFGDRLVQAAREKKTPVCLGIDPRPQLLPKALLARARDRFQNTPEALAWAYEELASRLLDELAPLVAATKIQSAFFEMLGPLGLAAMKKVITLARERGVVAIADAKRGDIGATSEAYAAALFGGTKAGDVTLPGLEADAATVNPYFGTDGVGPFLKKCDEEGRGLFVLVRTSNPSAAELQELDAAGRPFFMKVLDLVRSWASSRLGECGYSSIGAVAGANSPGALEEIRAAAPELILLVPGYGAQGGTAADVACAFDKRGEGAIVNASRSLVFARRDAPDLDALVKAASEAARRMRDEIAEAVEGRK